MAIANNNFVFDHTFYSEIDVPISCNQIFSIAHQEILIATHPLINFWPKIRHEPNQYTGVARLIDK